MSTPTEDRVLDPNPNPTSNTSNTPTLRDQGEFYMTGVLPVPSVDGEHCTVCLEPLVDDVVLVRACGHHFYCICVYAWFEGRGAQHAACPNCRMALYEPSSWRQGPREEGQTPATRALVFNMHHLGGGYVDMAMIEYLEQHGFRVVPRTPWQPQDQSPQRTLQHTPQPVVLNNPDSPRPDWSFAPPQNMPLFPDDLPSPYKPSDDEAVSPLWTRNSDEPVWSFAGIGRVPSVNDADQEQQAAPAEQEAPLARRELVQATEDDSDSSDEQTVVDAHERRDRSASRHGSEDEEMTNNEDLNSTELQRRDTSIHGDDEFSTASTDLRNDEMMLDIDDDVPSDHSTEEMDTDDGCSECSTIIISIVPVPDPDDEDPGSDGEELHSSGSSDEEPSDAGDDAGDDGNSEGGEGEDDDDGEDGDSSSSSEKSASEYTPDSDEESSDSDAENTAGKRKRKGSKAKAAVKTKTKKAQRTKTTARKSVRTLSPDGSYHDSDFDPDSLSDPDSY